MRLSHSRAIWWVALAVLIVNDHLFKGAGLLPGWLTGKLSDVAGLIVAPVLASFFVPRALAFGAVSVWFCAVKLSPAAAHAMEAATAAIGLHWRLWPDPTDLIALAVLPVTWRLAEARALPPRVRRVLPALLGAAACLATSKSEGPDGYRTSVYLVNTTLAPIEVRVYRASGTLNCAQLAASPEAAASSTFDAETCTTLAPAELMPLDRSWSYVRAAATAPPDCDAVILRAADLADTLLVWQQPSQVAIGFSLSPDELRALDDHAIILERAGDTLYAAGTSIVASLPATTTVPDVTCPSLPDARDAGRPDAGVDGGDGP